MTRWREEEKEVLRSLAGYKPTPSIVAAVQSLERRMNWEIRTKEAIEKQMVKMRLSAWCIYDNFTKNELARSLGVTDRRISTWISNGLPYKKWSSRSGQISCQDLKKWAKDNPAFLAGIEYDRLLFVLNDKTLSAQCSEQPMLKTGKPKKVKNITTGQVFSSMKEASKACYFSRSEISRAIAHQKPLNGCMWELVR